MKKFLRSLLILFILVYSYNSYAQQYNEQSFYKVDSLALQAKPKEALALIGNIYSYANQNKNANMAVKASIYRMLLQSYLQEDAIDTIIKNLRADIKNANQPQKSILQSILANTYWNYYQQNQYRISQRTEVVGNVTEDIKTWSLAQLNKEISKFYFLSIANQKLLQNVKIEDIALLTQGNQENKFYRPTLYDLLAHRAIEVFISPRYDFANVPEDNSTLPTLLINTEDFINHPIVKDSTSFSIKALEIFQILASFHQKNNNLNALADVELKRLKFIYDRSTEQQHQKFYDLLEKLSLKTKGTEIYAEILYEQALLLKNNKLTTDSNELYLQRSVNIAEEAVKAFPNSIGAHNATQLIRQIKAKELTFKVKQQGLPGKAFPIQLSYKNLDTLVFCIYKIGFTESKERYYKNEAEFSKYFQNKTAFRTWEIVLPNHNDYQLHTFIDKIDGLPSGNYLITALDKNSNKVFTLGRAVELQVSNLIANFRNKGTYLEYRVVNATDGAPVKTAKIQEAKYLTTFDADLKKTLTDQNGFALTNRQSDHERALITYQTDSLVINTYNYYRYGKEDDWKVVLFTDRPIYRPGQSVYYKGILLNTENYQNKIIPNEEVSVDFEDANGDEIASKKTTTNEFGSFQGSFVIPMGRLNGNMRIETPYGGIAIQVEEYKRPTFEITFDKLNQKYKLNDSVKVKGKAISFSGYAIGEAKLTYKILRRTLAKFEQYGYTPAQVKQVTTGDLKTNTDGKFEIRFKTESENLGGNYTFDIQVTVTSNNGETREVTKSIVAGKKDILVNSLFQQRLLLSKNRDTLSYQVTNLNNQPIKASVKTTWLLLKSPERLTNNTFSAEKYSFSREKFIEIFPTDEYNGENERYNWPVDQELMSKNLTTDSDGIAQFSLAAKDLSAGYYRVKTEAVNELKDTLTYTQIVRIYHTTPTTILIPTEWVVAQKTLLKPQEKAVFRLAGLNDKSKVFYEVYYKDKIEKQVWLNVSPKQSLLEIAALPHYEDSFQVQFFMVHQGVTYTYSQQVLIDNPKRQLNIKFLSFRDLLQPGEKESWKLKISNKAGDREIAEMVATLYDASLDKLRAMNWPSYLNNQYNYSGYNWLNQQIGDKTSHYLWYDYNYRYYSPIKRDYLKLNLFGFDYYGANNYAYRNYIKILNRRKLKDERLSALAKTDLVYGVVLGYDNLPIPGVHVKNGSKTAATDANGIYAIAGKKGDLISFSYIGFEIEIATVKSFKRMDVTLKSDNKALNEVVITAAGETQLKQTLTGAVTTISSASDLLQGKVAGLNIQNDQENVKIRGAASVRVEDNTVYSFMSMENYNPKTGMYMINGKPVFTKPEIAPRTNFNELAFFYPQLKTNENGEINVEFTIPQSLTRYKMMGFAHTKDLKTASISNELVTQKQLAVSVNAPRFFREGDTVWLSTSVNNLSGKALKGQSMLELKDALSGKIIQLSKTPVVQALDIANKGNQILKWQLAIPSQISAITYKVIAEAGKHTDGEEMTIPVLTNAMLVTESMPMNVRGNTAKTFEMEKLLKSGSSNTLRTQSLTLAYTANPAWYAIQALPYLMEYPYECAEQTFSRFYANSFATGIINSSPQIKTIFEQWQQAKNGEALLSNLEKNQELKTILLEETPWVRNAENETERKKRIATLFDLNRMSYELKNNFDKLQKMQLANGAFPWFAGMTEDRYITQHIVMGIGQLQKAKLIDQNNFPTFKTLTNKAIIYLDGQLIKDYHNEVRNNGMSRLPLHYLLARSYFNQQNNSADFNKAFNYYLAKTAASWMTMDSYQQAQAALVLIRNNNKTEALKVIGLLKQTAQQKEEMGMYWPNNTYGWWWYQSPIETQALLIEAFDEIANDQKSVEEMKIWLLKNKQTNDWKNTKATVAACYALLMKGYNLLSDSDPLTIKIGNQNIDNFKAPSASAEAGTGYEKVTITGSNIKPEMGKVEIKNSNKGIAWGALYWQYFEKLDKIIPSNTGIKIKKQLFLQNNTKNGDVLKAISSSSALKVGDLIKVRIEIYSDRAMEYLHLKDMRSAGFEPTNIISQYKYQDGLSYYESTKDAATNFFISYMPKGTYVFEYPLRVTHSGNFSNGVTSLQSMYAPEFTTYSEGIRTQVTDK